MESQKRLELLSNNSPLKPRRQRFMEVPLQHLFFTYQDLQQNPNRHKNGSPHHPILYLCRKRRKSLTGEISTTNGQRPQEVHLSLKPPGEHHEQAEL